MDKVHCSLVLGVADSSKLGMHVRQQENIFDAILYTLVLNVVSLL